MPCLRLGSQGRMTGLATLMTDFVRSTTPTIWSAGQPLNSENAFSFGARGLHISSAVLPALMTRNFGIKC